VKTMTFLSVSSFNNSFKKLKREERMEMRWNKGERRSGWHEKKVGSKCSTFQFVSAIFSINWKSIPIYLNLKWSSNCSVHGELFCRFLFICRKNWGFFKEFKEEVELRTELLIKNLKGFFENFYKQQLSLKLLIRKFSWCRLLGTSKFKLFDPPLSEMFEVSYSSRSCWRVESWILERLDEQKYPQGPQKF